MSKMQLKIKDIAHNQRIPPEYTCDDRGVSPEISWENLPEGTKSLALTIIDPDAPMGDFAHWLVYDIPVDSGSIPKGGPLPEGAKELINGFGKTGYGGPCPPSGNHHYNFTLYALSVETLEGVTPSTFIELLTKYKIDAAVATGLYRRTRQSF